MREYYKMSVHKVVLLKEGERLWTLKTINKDGSESVEEINQLSTMCCTYDVRIR